MHRIRSGLTLLGMCALTSVARADLPSTAPIYGSSDLDAIGAALQHSVSATRQNDSTDEAERRLRKDADAASMAGGSAATSTGGTMLIGGIALASSASWGSTSCVACIPSVILLAGGFQLTVYGLIDLGEYGGLHKGRGHRRRVHALADAMSHASIDAANAARRNRLTLAWTLLTTGVALAGTSVALFAMGHQNGLDDDARESLAAVSALAGGWFVSIASEELATRWTNELALAPTRAGAMLTYEHRW